MRRSLARVPLIAIATALLLTLRASATAPESLDADPFVIAVAPVSASSDTVEARAASLALEDDLARRLDAVSSPATWLLPARTFLLAASARPQAQPVRSLGEAKFVAGELGIARLLCLSLDVDGEGLSVRWQVYDPSEGGGTLAADRLSGHLADLPGFVSALAFRVGSALGRSDEPTLRRAVQHSLSLRTRAYVDYYRGRALLERGDTAGAASALASATAQDSAFVEARAWAAVCSAVELRGLVEQQLAAQSAESARQWLDASSGLSPAVRGELLTWSAEAFALAAMPAKAREAEADRLVALATAGDPAEALRLLPFSAMRFGASPELAVLESRLARLADDWLAAEETLKRAAAQWPGSPPILVEQARLYRAWAGRLRLREASDPVVVRQWLDYSKRMFESARALGGLPVDALAELAALELELGAPAVAGADADAVLAASPADPAVASLASAVSARALLASGVTGASERLPAAERQALAAGLSPLPGAVAPSVLPECWSQLALGWAEVGDMVRARRAVSLLRAHFGLTPQVLALGTAVEALAPPPPP